jgi:alpha-L-fucosidase
MMKEDLREGQRIEAFAFDVWDGRDWKETARGTTIGWKKLFRFPAVEATKVRVRLLKTRGEVFPSTPERFGLFFDPFRVNPGAKGVDNR